MRRSGLIAFLCLATSSAFAGLFGPSLVLANPVAASGAVNDPVFASLTHVWHLEEASGNARVDSVGSIALNETGGTVNRATGIHGLAADFQPVSQAGHYLTADSLFSGGERTVAMWVKVRSLPAAGTTFSLWGGTGPSTFLELDENGVLTFEDDSLEAAGHTVSVSLGTLNTWHFIVCTTDTSTEAISIDNGNFVSDASTGGADFAGLTLIIGSPEDGVNSVLVPDGLIDDPMTFSTALTQGNVTTLWNSGAGLFPSP